MLLCSIAIGSLVHWLVAHSCWLYILLGLLSSSNMPALMRSIIDLTSHRLALRSFFLKDNGIAVGTTPDPERFEERRMYEWRKGWQREGREALMVVRAAWL